MDKIRIKSRLNLDKRTWTGLLGGGTAILTTMLVLSRNDIGVDSKKVKCIAVAPPPVFRSNESHKRFEDHIQIFINQDDIVPRHSIY